MKVGKARSAVMIWAISALWLPAAYADECKDVLTNAIYDVTDYRHSSFVFMDRASTQSEKDHLDTSGAGGINIDGIPINVSDNHNADRQLAQSSKLTFRSEDRESVLLYSGQEKIISAWSACMNKHGGMKIRFEPNGSLFTNDILMHVEYWQAGGTPGIIQPALKLRQAVQIKDAKSVSDPNKCLQPSTTYKPGVICTVQIRTSSQWDSFSVNLPFTDERKNPFSVTAFLPARPQLRATSKPFPTSGDELLIYAWGNDTAAESNATQTRTVPAETGYFIKSPISASHTGNNQGYCTATAGLINDGTLAKLTVAINKVEDPGRQCWGHFQGSQVKLYWDPPPPQGVVAGNGR
jgi:hypothetical protein